LIGTSWLPPPLAMPSGTTVPWWKGTTIFEDVKLDLLN